MSEYVRRTTKGRTLIERTPWTSGEIRRLVDLYKAGRPMTTIRDAMQRSMSSVMCKLTSLHRAGIVGWRKKPGGEKR